MTITEKKHQEMVELAKPLVKWMNDNLHPHTVIIIETNGVQLLEGIIGHPITEFIVD